MADATIVTEELLSKEPGSKTVLVTVSGQLDESNVDEKAKIVYEVLDKNPEKLNLIFDFAGLEYMNSKSIGYLTDWYGRAKEKGGEMAIARAKQNIADILQVVGLTQLIKIHESLEQAKQALANISAEKAASAQVQKAPEQAVVTNVAAPATPTPADAPTAPAVPTPADAPTAPAVPTPADAPTAPAVPTPAPLTPEQPATPAPTAQPEAPTANDTYQINA